MTMQLMTVPRKLRRLLQFRKTYENETCKHSTALREQKKYNTFAAAESAVKPFSAVPAPPTLPFFGHLHLFSKFGPYSFEKLYNAYTELHKQYGPVVRLDLGIKMLLLFQPEDIETLFYLGDKYPQRPLFEALRHYRLRRTDMYSSAGLVSENGEEWHRLRKAVSFMMIPRFSKSYFTSQEEIANDFISRVHHIKNSSGEIPNFLQELYRYTEEAVGLVCFGTRLGLLDDLSSRTEFSAKLIEATDNTMKALADTLLGFPWWKIFNTPTYKKLVQSQDFFQSFAAECVKEAERKLNDARHKGNVELEFFRRLFENKSLKPSDISLLMTEIFSAGIDATGNAIGFLLYNLTKKPQVQEMLYRDIQKHSAEGLSPDSITEMKYLKACIQESHRLTPAAGGSARILSSPAVFSGYEIPAKVLCIGLHPVISRQEKHFDDPLDYRPERWLDDNNSKFRSTSHPYCVLPFSHGVRRCVGQRFAEQEIRLCIIKIIQKFRIEYDGPEIGSIMRLTLIPDKPLNLRFVER